MAKRGTSRRTTLRLCRIVEGVRKHARVTTTAVTSSKITTGNQVAGGRTSLVARSLRGSKRRSECPGVHVDNRAPGGLSLVECTKGKRGR